MDDELEVIRGQMEETRASLATKIDALETQLGDKVEGATEAVANTVETVQEAVTTVKDSLDLSKHVERHPWLMMGGAVAVGYLAGTFLAPAKPTVAEGYAEALPPPPKAAHSSNGNGRMHRAEEPAQEAEGPLHNALQMLKGLAVGNLMGLLRDMVTKVLPDSLAADATRVVDDLTEKMGGKLVPASESSGSRDEGDSYRGERNEAEMGRAMGAAQGTSEEPVGQHYRR